MYGKDLIGPVELVGLEIDPPRANLRGGLRLLEQAVELGQRRVFAGERAGLDMRIDGLLGDFGNLY